MTRTWFGKRWARVAAALLLFPVLVPAGAALTPEQATRVGGTLRETGARLSALQESALKIAEAAPGAGGALAAALQRVAEAPGARTTADTLSLLGLAAALLVALLLAYRRALRPVTQRLAADPHRARGAAGQLGIDISERVIVSVAGYLLVEAAFVGAGLPDLLALALVWFGVRWWFGMMLVEAILRPARPAYRLIPMSDAAARQGKAIIGATIFVGFLGIELMPVLLRAGLPVAAGQVLALAQGTFVAAGAALALWRYSASRPVPGAARRFWTVLVGAGILLLWLAWTIAVLLLDFAVYHAFTWSIRIAAFAYIAHALLGLSAREGWVLLLQRSISAAATLGIAILLAEVWLVDRLQLVAPEVWASTRHSLVAAAGTVFVGYVLWRYLYLWTEQRLHAPAPAGGGTHAASRLTTVLPMLRILAGAAILVVTALVALSRLGVEIAPLLAGAGVVGLAISFGAQTLVKDIITGAFFLVDDAFRVGEYIVSGNYKGEVEAISLRAVKLRHHRGSVYTIPFGELRAIQNMSRDWVIDKFSVGITYDSDIEKARKLIKQIGQKLAADPEYAPHILEPLKMQGVEQFGDFAVQVRVKMKTRPGEQFVIRRKANAMIKKAFDDNGIKFAFPTVQVSGGAGGDSVAAAAQQSLANAQPPAGAP